MKNGIFQRIQFGFRGVYDTEEPIFETSEFENIFADSKVSREKLQDIRQLFGDKRPKF
jgi:hypothetical protein